MIEIWLLITIVTLLIIYTGHKLYDAGYIQVGTVMILVGCLQLLAEGVALI